MSDYFIQIVIVKGNWSNAKSNSTNTTWSKYFTDKGIKKSMINTFLTSSPKMKWHASSLPAIA